MRRLFVSLSKRKFLISSLSGTIFLVNKNSHCSSDITSSSTENNAYALALQLKKSSNESLSNSGSNDDDNITQVSADLTSQALKALRLHGDTELDTTSNITGELASRIDKLLTRFVELSIEIADQQVTADLEGNKDGSISTESTTSSATTTLIESLSKERDNVVSEISTLMAPLASASIEESSIATSPNVVEGIQLNDMDPLRIQIAEERARIDDLITSLRTSSDEDSEVKKKVSELESSLTRHITGVKDFAKRATGWAKSAQEKITSSLESVTIASDKVDSVMSIATAASETAKAAKAAALIASVDADNAKLSAAHAAASAEKACMDASMSRADTAASVDALHMTVAAAQAAAASAKSAEDVARDRAALLAALSTRADLEKQVANDRVEALAASLKAAKAAQFAQAEADLLIAGFEAEKSRSSSEAAAAVRASEVSKRRAAESIERSEAMEATFKQSAFLASQEAAKASADAAKTLGLLRKQESDAREVLTQTLLSLQETRRQAEAALQETLSLATSARTAAAASTEEAVALAIERSAHAAAVADLIAEKAEAQARTVVAEQKLLQAKAFEETRVIFDEALQTQELAKVLVAQVANDVAENEAAAKAKADAAIAAAEMVAAQAVKDAQEAVSRATKEKKKAETERRIAETAVDVAKYKASKAAALAAVILAPSSISSEEEKFVDSTSNSFAKAVTIAETLSQDSSKNMSSLSDPKSASQSNSSPIFSYGAILPLEAEYCSRISAQIQSNELAKLQASDRKAEEELEDAIPTLLLGMRLRDTASNRERAKRYASTFGVKDALAAALLAVAQAKESEARSAISALSTKVSFFAPPSSSLSSSSFSSSSSSSSSSSQASGLLEQPLVKKSVTDYATAATRLLRRGTPVDHNEVLAARAEADADIAAAEAEAAAARAVLARHFANIKNEAATVASKPRPSGPEAYVSSLTNGKLHIAPEPNVVFSSNASHESKTTVSPTLVVPGETEYLVSSKHKWSEVASSQEAHSVTGETRVPVVSGNYTADNYTDLLSVIAPTTRIVLKTNNAYVSSNNIVPQAPPRILSVEERYANALVGKY